MRKYPCVLQKDSTDCGVACLASVLKYYKKEYSFNKLRELSGTDNLGTSGLGILEAAKKIGFESKAIKIEDKKINLDEFR